MKATLEGTKLILVIDLDTQGHPSKSGKRRIAFSTGGFVAVDGGYDVSINVLVPRS